MGIDAGRVLVPADRLWRARRPGRPPSPVTRSRPSGGPSSGAGSRWRCPRTGPTAVLPWTKPGARSRARQPPWCPRSGGPVRDERTVPYVGRPIVLTDVCQIYPFIGPDTDPPSVPSVWLGADVEVGSDDLGDGWVRETVEACGHDHHGHQRRPRPPRADSAAPVSGVRVCVSGLEEPTRVQRHADRGLWAAEVTRGVRLPALGCRGAGARLRDGPGPARRPEPSSGRSTRRSRGRWTAVTSRRSSGSR